MHYRIIWFVFLAGLTFAQARRIVSGDVHQSRHAQSAPAGLTRDFMPDIVWLSPQHKIYAAFNRGSIPIASDELDEQQPQAFGQFIASVKTTFSDKVKSCIGVLIEPRVVLVAGHCLKSPGNLYADKVLVELKDAKIGYRTYSGNMFATPKEFSMEADSDLYGNIGFVVLDQVAARTGSNYLASSVDVFSNSAKELFMYSWGGITPSESTATAATITNENTKLLSVEECDKRYRQLYNTAPARDKFCFELNTPSEFNLVITYFVAAVQELLLFSNMRTQIQKKRLWER